jgi:protein-tyrosine phosphatase
VYARKEKQISVLFVCTGNICRSPTAEGVFRQMVEKAGLGRQVHIDSAGTVAFHIGEGPDPRSQKAARNRGIDLSDLRARLSLSIIEW